MDNKFKHVLFHLEECICEDLIFNLDKENRDLVKAPDKQRERLLSESQKGWLNIIREYQSAINILKESNNG